MCYIVATSDEKQIPYKALASKGSVNFHVKKSGLMLAQSVIELARKDPNTHRVVSLVTSDNAASIKLHEKLGFRFVGTLTEAGCKFGRYLDVMYLELAV